MTEKNLYSIKQLHDFIKNNSRIAIYGAGDYGKMLIDYLISIRKEKVIKALIISAKNDEQNEYKGIKIMEAGYYLQKEEGSSIIIAVSSAYQKDIEGVVCKYSQRYSCITYELYQEIEKTLQIPYRGADFMLAGFAKCGTTSLHKVLYGIRDIYLSENKESQFFDWCTHVDDPLNVLAEKYFNHIRNGQIVGMIEPSFARKAKEVYDYFGDKIKIIFSVRNPVNATFSRFKMFCRIGMAEFDELYLKGKGNYYDEMFDDYLERTEDDTVVISKYVDYINKFLQYYPKNQIKVIIFEELVQNPQKIINEVLKFIGSEERCCIETLPKVNEGDYILANYEGYKLAREERYLIKECKHLVGAEYEQKKCESIT